MKTQDLIKELEARTGIKKLVWAIIISLILIIFMLTIIAFSRKTIVQTILVPPQIQRTMTISNNEYSKEYLEEIGAYLTSLLLNATPETVEYQHQLLLKYVSPKYRDALNAELKLTERYIKKNNISTYFTTRKGAADPKDGTLTIDGVFKVSVGKKITETQNKKFLISFNNDEGKLSLVSIKEVVAPARGKQSMNEVDVQEPQNVIEETTTEEFEVRDYSGSDYEVNE